MSYKCLKNNKNIQLVSDSMVESNIYDSYAPHNDIKPQKQTVDSHDDSKEPSSSLLVNLYYNAINRKETKNLEKFCFLGLGDGCGSSDTTSNLTKNTSKLNKVVNESMLATSINTMVNAAMTNALLINKSTLTVMAQADNDMAITGNNLGKDGLISGINQSASSTTKVDTTVKQENVASVSNDFQTQISKIVDKAVSDFKSILNNSKNNSQNLASTTSGMGVGDTIAAVAGAMTGTTAIVGVAGAAAGVLTNCFGGGTNKSSSTTVITDIQEEINIDNSMKQKSENNVKNIMETILSAENLASAVSNARSANKLVIANNNAKIITNIRQEAIAINITKTLVDQVNKINVGNKVLNRIDNVMRSVNNKYLKSEDNSTNNSINKQQQMDAVGQAMVGIVTAVGEGGAAILKGAGSGIGTAFEGAGTGVSTAATGVGAGVSSIGKTLMWPLIIIGSLVALAFVFKMMSSRNNQQQQ
jgi:hypothetical protein